MSSRILNVIYFILVIAFAGTSTYLSYFGFYRNFEELAWVFAGSIGLWLVGANLVIQRNRLAGRGVLSGLVMLMFGAFFSFVSNFNYLYTNAMERDVAVETVASAHDTFKGNLITARRALERTDVLEQERELRTRFERELSRLRAQVLDPLNPGVGPEARGHIAVIEGLLGGRMTNLAAPRSGQSIGIYEAWFENFRRNAVADFERSVADKGGTKVEAVISDINRLLERYSIPPDGAAAEDLDTIRAYSTQTLNIELRANELLSGENRVTLKSIDFMDGRLGEIEFSMYNGFVERPNFGATILSAVIALAVDLFPLVFALFAFHGPRTPRFHEPQPPRRRSSRNNLG
ncbi:hypothetical protein [Palleronia caenipelagi]|uniref:Uncharacterized protein n=1 Tax=Palleronia caenipelagi TaxID=2489174 RepID=A0A547PMT6_9RHOB|nr:hypothetical protein [Palleronia caenipelagi]TRD15469.1 hypothetical protein FEV53_16270 [Palleronia caenipelagi]